MLYTTAVRHFLEPRWPDFTSVWLLSSRHPVYEAQLWTIAAKRSLSHRIRSMMQQSAADRCMAGWTASMPAHHIPFTIANLNLLLSVVNFTSRGWTCYYCFTSGLSSAWRPLAWAARVYPESSSTPITWAETHGKNHPTINGCHLDCNHQVGYDRRALLDFIWLTRNHITHTEHAAKSSCIAGLHTSLAVDECQQAED
jgi:hypothetical protein